MVELKPKLAGFVVAGGITAWRAPMLLDPFGRKVLFGMNPVIAEIASVSASGIRRRRMTALWLTDTQFRATLGRSNFAASSTR
jgi:hypothetical protein